MAELVQMGPEQLRINSMLMALDLARHRMEMKWGVGRLIEVSSEDMVTRWSIQEEKLKGAIIENDVASVEELVAGSIRGLAAMDRAGLESGATPYEVQYWSVAAEPSGQLYRVVRDGMDMAGLVDSAEAPVIDLQALVNVYHVRVAETFKTPVRPPGGEFKASGKPMDEELGF